MAASAGIRFQKKRKLFETNPSIRKRQQKRLMNKLKATIDELATRAGQQAVVLVATPEEPFSLECFGAKPLENVMKKFEPKIRDDLEAAYAQPPAIDKDPLLHDLPSFHINGALTSVTRMTQVQLRAFIPIMLKYSTGRQKPGWGIESLRPPWWPKDIPWASIQKDPRSKEEKKMMPWTDALKQIVIECYQYHDRDDLLLAYFQEGEGNEENEEGEAKEEVGEVNEEEEGNEQEEKKYCPTNSTSSH